MSTKPWDVLRKPVKSPICVGKWETSTGVAMELCTITGDSASLKLGWHPAGATSYRGPTLREMGEFLIELADQISEGGK